MKYFITTLIIILGWVGLATYADTCFKKAPNVYSQTFLIGLTCYTLTSFFAIMAFKRQEWAWIILMWNCISLVISLVLSVWMFHEQFTTRRALASVLVLLAILLIE